MKRPFTRLLLIYLVLLSMLVMPLRALAYVDNTPLEKTLNAACHSVVVVKHHEQLSPLMTQTHTQQCCDESSMKHDCTQCYGSTLMTITAPDLALTIAEVHALPIINAFSEPPRNNIYRPPRFYS